MNLVARRSHNVFALKYPLFAFDCSLLTPLCVLFGAPCLLLVSRCLVLASSWLAARFSLLSVCCALFATPHQGTPLASGCSPLANLWSQYAPRWLLVSSSLYVTRFSQLSFLSSLILSHTAGCSRLALHCPFLAVGSSTRRPHIASYWLQLSLQCLLSSRSRSILTAQILFLAASCLLLYSYVF